MFTDDIIVGVRTGGTSRPPQTQTHLYPAKGDRGWASTVGTVVMFKACDHSAFSAGRSYCMCSDDIKQCDSLTLMVSNPLQVLL